MRSLQWNSKESQLKRFNSLLRIGDLNNSRILDIGCGTGDLLTFLSEGKIFPTYYLGIDLIDEFISVAKEKHPGYDFIIGDFFEINFQDKFDFVICNGALNVREKDNMNLLNNTIQKSFQILEKGMGVTLLKYSPSYFEDQRLCHYKETEVASMVKEITNQFQIYSDYTDNDFTLVIYK